jgi:putative transposase
MIRGIDGGKRNGKNIHIITDIMGNLLSVVVHAANIHDTKSGMNPTRQAFETYSTIQKILW